MILENQLHVAPGQIGHLAVTGNEVEATCQLVEGHHPGRAEAVGTGRRLAPVIPVRVQAAGGGGIADIVVPQVQTVVGKGSLNPARRYRLGIHQSDHRLIWSRHQQLPGRVYLGQPGNRIGATTIIVIGAAAIAAGQ